MWYLNQWQLLKANPGTNWPNYPLKFCSKLIHQEFHTAQQWLQHVLSRTQVDLLKKKELSMWKKHTLYYRELINQTNIVLHQSNILHNISSICKECEENKLDTSHLVKWSRMMNGFIIFENNHWHNVRAQNSYWPAWFYILNSISHQSGPESILFTKNKKDLKQGQNKCS